MTTTNRHSSFCLLLLTACCLFAYCNSHETSDSKVAETSARTAAQSELVIAEGKKLFKENCAACHGTDSRRAEPGLIFTNLFERLPAPSQEYFLRFVRNSDELMKEKDPFYMKIDSLYSISIKHQYKDKLSDKELKVIMAYLLKINKGEAQQ